MNPPFTSTSRRANPDRGCIPPRGIVEVVFCTQVFLTKETNQTSNSDQKVSSGQAGSNAMSDEAHWIASVITKARAQNAMVPDGVLTQIESLLKGKFTQRP